jgi:DNA processing protein
LKQGATLVTEVEDVLAVLRPILGQPLDRSMQEAEPIAPAPPIAEPDNNERSHIVELLGPTRAPVPEGRKTSKGGNHLPAGCQTNRRVDAGR